MTYIISGKLNGRIFLVVDCVGTQENIDKTKSYKFTNKLDKLVSAIDETYCCITGIDTYRFAIRYFDMLCYQQNLKFDFKNEEHINKVIDIFKKLKIVLVERGYNVENYCRMYFINKEDAYYYEVGNKGEISRLYNIGENYYVCPSSMCASPNKLKKVLNTNNDLLSFCKKEINHYNQHTFPFKNRFSHVIFENDTVDYYNSIDNLDELVLSVTDGDFDRVMEKI